MEFFSAVATILHVLTPFVGVSQQMAVGTFERTRVVVSHIHLFEAYDDVVGFRRFVEV